MIVKFRDAATSAAAQRGEALPALQVDRLSARAGQPLGHDRAMSGGAFVMRLFQALSAEQARSLAANLAADPAIEYAEPDMLMQPQLVPNDPSYASQWHYKSPPARAGRRQSAVGVGPHDRGRQHRRGRHRHRQPAAASGSRGPVRRWLRFHLRRAGRKRRRRPRRRSRRSRRLDHRGRERVRISSPAAGPATVRSTARTWPARSAPPPTTAPASPASTG